MPLKQVLLVRLATGSTVGADEFDFIFNPNDSIAGSDGRIHTYFPFAGVLKNLYWTTTSAPTSGNAGQFILQKNGSDTALTASITVGLTVGQDITNKISVAAGDHISYRVDATGTGVAGNNSITLEFVPTTNKASVYGSNDTNAVMSSSAANYMPVFAFSGAWGSSAATQLSMSAIPGNIKGYILAVNVAPGNAKSWTGAIYKSTNGGASFVKQDGTGGTVDTTAVITGAGSTQVTASFTLPVSPGDMFYFENTPAGTPTLTRAGVTFGFLADNANEYNISGNCTAFSNSATRYNQVNNYNGIGNTGTEANVESFGGYTPVRLDQLYVSLAAAPGAAASGKSLTLRLRKNTTNAGAVVTVLETATTGNDTSTAAIEITRTDKVAISMVPASTPTTSVPVWAMRAKTNPGDGGAGKGHGGGTGGGPSGIQINGSTKFISWRPMNYFGI